jgi:tRNA (guanine-N7-)-methyltransferase
MSEDGKLGDAILPGAERGDNGIRTYVLRAGRMTDGQKRALEDHGRRLVLPFEAGARLDYRATFGRLAPVVCEIGFGMGMATWRIAEAMPDRDFLGIEVHTPGVGKLVSELAAHGLRNVRIIHHDAVEVLEKMIPEGSLAGFHIFYPDPWPKKRHHKRRLIRPGLVELLASRLASGGYLYFVTDIEAYAAASLEVLSATPGFRNRYEGYAPRQEWRPETKFENRASAQGRPAFELFFEKS